MNRIVTVITVAVMLLLFIKDSHVTKKIWAAATAAASAAAMVYITVVYGSYGKKLQKISYEHLDKAKWQSDFNTYVLCIVVLLLIAAAVIFILIF